MLSPIRKPLSYTTHEGGRFTPWPKKKKFNIEWLNLRSKKSNDPVDMDGLKVFSLSWSQISAPTFYRWDCILGFDVWEDNRP